VPVGKSSLGVTVGDVLNRRNGNGMPKDKAPTPTRFTGKDKRLKDKN